MAIRDKKELRVRRHLRIRKKVSGTPERPRFAVSVTTNNIYCQFIDDVNGVTLAQASTMGANFKEAKALPNMDGAALLGKLAAESAAAANITEVVFDRCGYRYHGRVKAIAEAAKANGLKF